jgi:hypothetical protein
VIVVDIILTSLYEYLGDTTSSVISGITAGSLILLGLL